MQANGQVKVSTQGPPTTRHRTWSKLALGALIVDPDRHRVAELGRRRERRLARVGELEPDLVVAVREAPVPRPPVDQPVRKDVVARRVEHLVPALGVGDGVRPPRWAGQPRRDRSRAPGTAAPAVPRCTCRAAGSTSLRRSGGSRGAASVPPYGDSAVGSTGSGCRWVAEQAGGLRAVDPGRAPVRVVVVSRRQRHQPDGDDLGLVAARDHGPFAERGRPGDRRCLQRDRRDRSGVPADVEEPLRVDRLLVAVEIDVLRDAERDVGDVDDVLPLGDDHVPAAQERSDRLRGRQLGELELLGLRFLLASAPRG